MSVDGRRAVDGRAQRAVRAQRRAARDQDDPVRRARAGPRPVRRALLPPPPQTPNPPRRRSHTPQSFELAKRNGEHEFDSYDTRNVYDRCDTANFTGTGTGGPQASLHSQLIRPPRAREGDENASAACDPEAGAVPSMLLYNDVWEVRYAAPTTLPLALALTPAPLSVRPRLRPHLGEAVRRGRPLEAPQRGRRARRLRHHTGR